MPNILLVQTLALSTPLILAAMGGYASERSGVVNIGLEGLMLSAACAAALAAPAFGPVAALGIALAVAVVLSLCHWLATQVYRIDQVISGMAINLLAAGGTNFAAGLARAASAGVPHLPVGLYEGAALLVPFGIWAYVRSTRGGLRLIATGADPAKARLAGLVPERIRFAALLATGVFAGLGGVMLVSYTEGFSNDMVSGRGYIALAALVLGGWRPLPTFVACLAFGLMSALRISVRDSALPSEFWTALPYLATVVALAGFLGRGRVPAGLGKP